MKKVSQGSRRSISCDVVPSKNVRNSSFKCTSGSKFNEKTERQRTSRVKFKETVASSVRTSQSVQFVRNTELPVKKTHSLVSFNPGLKDKFISLENVKVGSQYESECDVYNHGDNQKLDIPELCTSLKVANRLLEEAAAESKTTLGKSCLTDTSSTEGIRSKVLRKVNIPFEEQIYKNLVDLKITDNDLHYGQDKRVKSRHFERVKEKEPELSEFYKPSFNEEYILKIEKLHIEPEKVISYDGFSISDRMKNWELP